MRRFAAFVAACFLVPPSPLAAQQPKPLFASEEPIHIVIQGPISSVVNSRSSAVVQGVLTDPTGQQLPVGLSVRSTTRRKDDVCDFPPLRVQFTTPPPPTSVFARQKKLKLVTHCRNSPSFQQKVLLEYAAYRMLNVLSPRSFRVRLANIDYVNADRRPVISRIGFFIEDLGDVAKRNGTKATHGPNLIPIADLSAPDAARYALFQHMIANHDWSMRAGPAGKDCCHNAELIGPLGTGTVVPIPYDFDFSGLVDAPYAIPPDQLQISSVRERVYRGYCVHNADVLAEARQMRAARPQLIAAITTTPGMDPGTASKAISYLDGFFADIATDDAVNSRLLRRCVN
jgi:hypothetical protein